MVALVQIPLQQAMARTRSSSVQEMAAMHYLTQTSSLTLQMEVTILDSQPAYRLVILQEHKVVVITPMIQLLNMAQNI